MTAGKLSAEQEKLYSLIKDIGFAMLTTACADGTLRSRPMATQSAEFEGDLWFFTPEESGKVEEVQQDQHVNLAYADPSNNRYVSVSGVATVSRDKAKIKQLWSPALKAWFPNGPDDPSIALLRVHPTIAEYWDAPSSKMVQLFGLIKATLTGQRAHPEENEKLTLDRDSSPNLSRRPGEGGSRSAGKAGAARASDDPRPHGDPLGKAAQI